MGKVNKKRVFLFGKNYLYNNGNLAYLIIGTFKTPVLKMTDKRNNHGS